VTTHRETESQWKSLSSSWSILSSGIPGILATVVGASLAFRLSSTVLSRVLGAFLVLYVPFLVVHSSFQIRPCVVTSVLGDVLSGFFAGVFGMGGAVRGMFLSAFDLPKAIYLATAGAIALAIDTFRLITYVREGTQLNPLLSWAMLLFIPASFVGAWIAKRFVNRIPQRSISRMVPRRCSPRSPVLLSIERDMTRCQIPAIQT